MQTVPYRRDHCQLQPTIAEQRDFDELSVLVTFLESKRVSTRSSQRGSGGPPVVLNWNVPAGLGFDSAFDIIDFVGRQRQLGNVAIAASPVLADAVLALANSTGIINVKLIFNLEFAYQFNFPDGSSGLFVFNT